MATIKVACPKCGQKVSGDESFFGAVVECPICSSDILFPGQTRTGLPQEMPSKAAPEPAEDSVVPGPREPACPDTHPDAVIRSSGVDEPVSEPLPEKWEEEALSAPQENADGDEEDLLLPPSPIFGAISIVSALLGVITCPGGVLFAPLAIIFGHTALAKARHSPVQPAPGHTLGAIGLMIGYINLVLLILLLLAMVIFGEAIRGAVEPFFRSLYPG